MTKEQSNIVKGFAILLMLVHHFFTFPQWIMGGYTPNPQFVSTFNSPTKLCVCMFAFLNGWAFAIDEATYRRAFRKIKKLLINYWCIAIPATIFAIWFCGYKTNAWLLVKILFGFDTALMIFAWYVPFYCVSILVMTCIKKLLDRNILAAVVFGVVAPILVFSCLKRISATNEIKTLFNNLKHWFPCVAVGYISNKYSFFNTVEKKLEKVNGPVLSIFLIVACFVGRRFISGLDFIYCFLMVYGILHFGIIANSYLGRFLQFCGKKSSNMWFLHCLYFGSATRNVIQPLAYFSNNSIVIYFIAVIELLIASIVIDEIKKATSIKIKVVTQWKTTK